MLLQKLPAIFKRRANATVALLLVCAVLLSTVAILNFASVAESPDQMITISSDGEKISNVVIPIADSSLSGNQYFRLTFKAKMITGDKPIIGALKINQQATKYSYLAKPDYVDNEDGGTNPSDTSTAPDLYCKYNASTMEYTAVIQLSAAKKLPSGAGAERQNVFGAITIGNTEYGTTEGSDVATSDLDVEFTFAKPELKRMVYTGDSWQVTGNNLLPALISANIDFSKNYTDTFPMSGTASAIKTGDTLLSAPAGKYATVNAQLLAVADYVETLSTGHSYIYHELVEPTTKAEGSLPYYTCNCGECDGKYFSKKDQSAVIEDPSTLILAQSTAQMIVINQSNKISNAFIPLNVKAAVANLGDPDAVTGGLSTYTVYAKVTFKARMFGGSMPVLGIVSADGSALKDAVDNEDKQNDGMVSGTPDLYCVYDPSTLTYEAVVAFEVNNATKGADMALTIGNAEHGGSNTDTADYKASFAFSDPRMTILDPTTGQAVADSPDLLPEINSYNAKFEDELFQPIVYSALSDVIGAPLRDWGRDGADNTAEATGIPETFFAATHHFVETAKIPATSSTEGRKAYYTCDCGAADCCFKDKKYLDKGWLEAKSEAELILPKLQMIKVGAGNNNVFVPLNLSEYIKPEYKDQGNYSYVRLTFTARMFEGEKPIVSRIRGSSDKGGDYSWSEPDYADNSDNVNDGIENKNDGGTVKGPDLYCTYDPVTLKYEAVIRIQVMPGTWSCLSNGIHDAILIGNSEHNGTGYTAESDDSVSFAFCNPELYFLNASTGAVDTSTGNLLPVISDDTLNFNTSYKHNNNPCTLENHILSAPAGMWSKDNDTTGNITAEEIPENYFKYYNFVYHKQVNPTKTTKGSKAYYTCECGDPSCIYAGKKYVDKGNTEYAEEDLVLSYSQMIKVGSGANNNVFVPLNLKPYVKSKHKKGSSIFVQLTFTARMIEGKKPVVSRVRGSSDYGGDYSWSEPYYADNTNETGGMKDGKPVLYTKYDEDTCQFTAVIQLEVGQSYSTLSNGIHDAILIGNAEHNAKYYTSESDSTVSFAFCDPELYLIDLTTGEVDTSTGNLMPAICEETLNFDKEYKHDANPCKASNHLLSAPKDKWSIDGSKSNIEAKGIPDDYFKPYKFVLHEEVRPTSTTTGMRAYYTCECKDPTCIYKGKKYSDKGMTEVTDSDLFLSKSKMITVDGGNNTNVYVPIDLKPYVKSQHKSGSAVFVQLTFTARMLEGKKPIVSRVRGSSDQQDSNGNPIQGTWSEPYYTDNATETGGMKDGKPILYTKYDEDTCKFTAVIELWVGQSYSTLSNGVHDAILIGHAEHNGPGFHEMDSTVAFSFCDPELYLIDLTTGQIDTSTGNLMPAICDENINFSKEYKHNANPCKLSNHLLSAPKNRWSIDGSASDARAENIPANYFKPYKFVLHKEVRPTSTTTGMKAYYTCECKDPDCIYKGKKFSDKGTTEVTDDDLFLGTTKMITVDGYNYSNVYVPLDLKPYATAKHKSGSTAYLQLTFTARMLNGAKPIVSVVRGSSDKKDASGNQIQGTWSEPPYADNNNDTGGLDGNGKPILYAKYDEETCKFTAVIQVTVGASWATLANGVHTGILIGHAEHNGPGYKENDQSVSFSFCDPELYFIDLTTGKADIAAGNLLPAICDETVNFGTSYAHTTDNPCKLSNHLLSAPKDMWSVDGSLSCVHLGEIPENYFRPLYGAYTIGTTGRVATEVSLEPNTEYVLRFGSKYYDDEIVAKPLVELKTASGTVTETGDFAKNIGGQYNTVYTFKTPANLSGGVNATVGVNIDSAQVQGVFSNFELYKVKDGKETGQNLISDPTLSGAGAGDPETIWTATGMTYKPITINQFKMTEPKMLMFSGKNGMNTHLGANGKVEYGQNQNGYLENFATIENGKQYVFSMNYKFAGTGYRPDKQDLSDEIGPKVLVKKAEGGFTELTEGKTEIPDEYKLTYIFTADGLAEEKNNFKLHFDVIGACTSGYLSNVTLYEYNGKKAVGDQLLKNGDFATGDASGWTVSSSDHFYQFEVLDIPENFFTKEGPKPNMIVFRNSTDYYRYDQHLMIKPNTRYQLEWQLKITDTKNDESKPVMSFYVDIFNKKDDGSYLFRSDGINVTSTNIPLPKAYKDKECQSDPIKLGGDNYALRFTTTDEVRATGNGNTYVRLYTMAGSAGYWGKIALYELDAKGNKVGNNIVLNGDFTCGLAGWMPSGDTTDRVVQQPEKFFNTTGAADPKDMIYSDGSSANQTYGNTFKVKANRKYYFAGTYVNMNAEGLTPEVMYLASNGKYKKLEATLFYDPNRYFFEIEFTAPEDALLEDGMATVKVQINNNQKGKGYLANLSLTEEGYYTNLFNQSGFKSSSGNYQKMSYNSNVFVFYYDDSAFDDGNWSGEAVLITDSTATGRVLDATGSPMSGVRMLLSPGYSAKTDSEGTYLFEKVKEGTYTLYLVDPKTGERIYCTEIYIGEAKSVLFPVITYTETENVIEAEIEEEEIEVRERAVLQGLVYDENGKRLAGIPIYVEDNGYKVTNEKGIFTFNNLTEFGEKKVYMYLEDGSKYVFRKVKLEAGKGLRIKLKYKAATPKKDNGLAGWIGDNLVLFIVICAGAAVLIAGGTTLLVLLLKKKKKAKAKVK